jgi:SRSO17 transposase
MPDDAVHHEKWRLGLDMIDEMAGWGLRPPLIVADAGYGDAAEFRQELDNRSLAWIVGVNCAHTAFTEDTPPSSPPRTPSAPCNAWTQKPVRRNDALRRTPTPAGTARPHHRHLPHLQNPLPTTENITRPRIMTKHY